MDGIGQQLDTERARVRPPWEDMVFLSAIAPIAFTIAALAVLAAIAVKKLGWEITWAVVTIPILLSLLRLIMKEAKSDLERYLARVAMVCVYLMDVFSLSHGIATVIGDIAGRIADRADRKSPALP